MCECGISFVFFQVFIPRPENVSERKLPDHEAVCHHFDDIILLGLFVQICRILSILGLGFEMLKIHDFPDFL